jgi:hypothetical protein
MADTVSGVIAEWFGSIVEQEIIDSLVEAVEESDDDILRDAVDACPMDTGALAESGQKLPAKVGRKEVYGRVIFGGGNIRYAMFPELKSKFLRRALNKNETKSLMHFEGKLGVGKRRAKKGTK